MLDTRRAALLGMLVALGAALHLVESQFPAPLPWVRLGLANLVTLLAAAALGLRAALLVAVLRVVAGSLLAGGFLGPGFLLSLGGATAAACAMGAMAGGIGRFWSPLGVSVAGAVAHAATQLALVAALFVRSREALLLAPWVLLPALASGVLTGLLASPLLRRWQGVAEARA